MSPRLISRSDDLRRVRAAGYSVDVVGGKLIVRDVPFVNADRAVQVDGVLVMPLQLAGDVVVAPPDHTASFGGGVPHTASGQPLSTVVNGTGRRDLGDGIVVDCSCSMKPDAGDPRYPGGKYPDFFMKVTCYVAAITGQAVALDPSATAAVFRPVVGDVDGDSPFVYANTASSRAGIDAINEKLRAERVAIVGLGGTGQYILDLVAKTEVAEIHLFDPDRFLTHNAFRAPGAASLEDLTGAPFKVEHFAAVYGRMRTGIVAHPYAIEASNVLELSNMTFVFVAIDGAEAKQPIVDALVRLGIAFVDVGLGVENVDGRLTGSVRTTIVIPERPAAADRIPVVDVGGPDEYRTNIQIAELNARNATDAVIAWKKYREFYANLGNEHFSVYNVSTNHIVNEEEDPDERGVA